MSRVTLTLEQANVLADIERFLARPMPQVFVLHGLAGTGKTTVLSAVARRYPDAILCTLTGKAASVLRRKTGLPACTIHSAFYQLKNVTKDDKGRRRMNWDQVHAQGELRSGVILLDECSMVDEAMAMDMLRTGAKIIACGDPGQLPPVRGQAFFNQPDAELVTVHRQALESPIIRQAHAVRAGRDYQEDGADFRVTNFASDDDVLSANAILTWKHSTRIAANAEARRLRGLWMPSPRAGEPVMCLRNAPDLGIYNGGVYTLLAPFHEGDTVMRLAVDDGYVDVPRATFAGLRNGLDDDERVIPFEFGYAMTVHKAQGSEWDSVILMDEFRGEPAARRQWQYTAITRAAKSILVVR